jgi:hypothetical protein
LIGLVTQAIALGAQDETALQLGALRRLVAGEDWVNVDIVLEGLATSWAGSDLVEPAAQLLGYFEASGRGHALLARRRARALEQLRASSEAEHWRSVGATLSRDQAIDLAAATLEARA